MLFAIYSRVAYGDGARHVFKKAVSETKQPKTKNKTRCFHWGRPPRPRHLHPSSTWPAVKLREHYRQRDTSTRAPTPTRLVMISACATGNTGQFTTTPSLSTLCVCVCVCRMPRFQPPPLLQLSVSHRADAAENDGATHAAHGTRNDLLNQDLEDECKDDIQIAYHRGWSRLHNTHHNIIITSSVGSCLR